MPFTFPTHRLALALPAAALALGACSGLQAGGPSALGAIPCPKERPIAYVAVDISSTARSTELVDDRLQLVQSALTDTAKCGGDARVIAFAGSSTATRTLFDGSLQPEGATTNARLRRVPKLVRTAMSQVRANLTSAIRSLPGGGTDVLAQFGLASEFREQIGTTRPLTVYLATDGIQATSTLTLDRQGLTPGAAEALASRVTVPTLTNAAVTLAGIGRVAGVAPATTFTDALKHFWTVACRRTSAICVVVSDFAAEG